MGVKRPKNYKSIREEAQSYQEKILLFKGQVYSKGGIDFDKIPLVILMEKANIKRLLDQHGCEKIAAVLNVEGDHFTVALLCVDNEDKVFSSHINGSLDGEETWPEEDMIKISDSGRIASFLAPPQFS